MQVVGIQRIPQILRHRGVGHLVGTAGKTVIAHINLKNIVVGNQIARQHAQVIQAAKKPVNQYDGRIIVRRLCSLRSGIQFHGKVLFLRMSG